MKMATVIQVASIQIVMATVNDNEKKNIYRPLETEEMKFKYLSLFLVHHRLDRTYSLPRTAAGASSHGQRYSHQPHTEGYYTQDRRRNNTSRANSHHQSSMDDAAAATTAMDKPDFYFMPSQRKYSGEVVRVYVDYNKDMKK